MATFAAFSHTSFDEFVRVYDRPVYGVNENHESGEWKDEKAGTDWYRGARSREELTALLDRGWNEGADTLANLVRELPEMPAAHSRKRRPAWSDNGDELSIDRALAGQWDNAWRTTTRVSARGPVSIDIVALCGGAFHRSSEELFWSGATCVVATDILESAGYSVRLVGASISNHDTSGLLCTAVTLKDTHEPLRPDVVASVMCHAGVFRTHMFRARLALPAKCDYSMGCTCGWDRSEVVSAATAAGLISDDTVKLTQTYDRESCIAQIKKVIARVDQR